MKSVSILYIEDNDDLRDTIGVMLEGEAREVVCLADGEQAIEALAKRDFDVVVTDVSLPGLSGIELARHVLARNPRQWVVLCSGYEFRAGLEQFGPHVRALTKPFEVEDLEALLGEISASIRGAV